MRKDSDRNFPSREFPRNVDPDSQNSNFSEFSLRFLILGKFPANSREIPGITLDPGNFKFPNPGKLFFLKNRIYQIPGSQISREIRISNYANPGKLFFLKNGKSRIHKFPGNQNL